MSKRVLVVEDSATIRKTIELALTLEDYQLDMVETPDEALNKIQGLLPDLIICDVSLPEIDGYELSDKIVKSIEGKKVPILLLVGSFEAFDKERANAIGIDDLMIKPFESAIFIEKSRELVEKGVQDVVIKEPSGPAVEEAFELEETEVSESPFVEAESVSLSEATAGEIQETEAFELEVKPPVVGEEEVQIAEVIEEPVKAEPFADFSVETLEQKESEPAAEVYPVSEAELFEVEDDKDKVISAVKEPSIDELFVVEASVEPEIKPHAGEPAFDIFEETGKKEGEEALREEAKAEGFGTPFEEGAITEAGKVDEFAKLKVEAPEFKEAEVVPEFKRREVFASGEEIEKAGDEEIAIKPLSSMLSNEVVRDLSEKAVKAAVEEVVWGVVPELIEEIKKVASAKIQEIAWEVIPELAENYIKDEIERLKREK